MSRFFDARHVIAATGFEQQDVDVSLFSASTCHHGTGRPRAADEAVVMRS
jgi:hypothetical protein